MSCKSFLCIVVFFTLGECLPWWIS